MADLNAALEWARKNPDDERSKKLLNAVSSGKITSDSVKAKSIIQEQQQTKEPGGIIGAVKTGIGELGANLRRRGEQMLIKSGNVPIAGETPTSTGSKIFQTAGQAVGVFADIAGALTKTTLSALTPDIIEKPVNELIGKGVSKVASTEAVKTAAQAWDKFQQNHPELAGNTEAAGNFINLFAQAYGAKGTMVGAGKTIGTAAKIAQKAASKTGRGAASLTKFATSQATGLSPSTIEQVVKTPGLFTTKEMATIDRKSIASRVKSAVEKRLESLSETGKQYELVRKSAEKAIVPKGTYEDILSKYGLSLKNGKIVTTAESVPLSSGDISSIEGFLKQYGQKELSGNAFMNARKALSNMAKYDTTKTDVSQRISRELRSKLDEIGKGTFKGLSELDKQYGPEVKLLSRVKKEILNPDGTLKDTAMSKIANITGKGKEQALERLEKIIPGIKTDVNILKAIEDIEITKGQKVGAYLRGATGGFVASGGNPMAAVGAAIVSSPQVAIPLIRTYAKAQGVASKVVNGIIDKLKSGTKLVGNEYKIVDQAFQSASSRIGKRITGSVKGNPAGLSVNDISKVDGRSIPNILTKIDKNDGKIMEDFIDNVRLRKNTNVDLEIQARKMAEAMGLNADIPNSKLADKFDKILSYNFTKNKK